MAVPTDAVTEQVFVGAGTASPLAITFPFIDGSDLVVTAIVDGEEDVAALVRGVDYSVAGGNGRPGIVTPAAAIPVGTSWRVRRETPIGQPATLPSGSFSPKQIETAIDRQALGLQEQQRELGRAVMVPRGTPAPTLSGFGAALPGDVVEVTGPNSLGPVPYENSRLFAAVSEASGYAQLAFDASREILYPTIADGLFETSNGEEFNVDNDDGSATVYLNNNGTAIWRRDIMLTPTAARASQLIGFQQGGVGAVPRRVEDKLRETVSAKDYGAVGDNIADDTAAILAAMATGKAVDLGGSENTYRVTATMLVTASHRILFGSGATIRMDHSIRGFVTPILRVTGDYFRSWGIKWDHDAEGVPLPAVSNQVAVASLDAVMLGGDSFDFSGEAYNAAVNGIGIGAYSFTGIGTVGSPLSGTQTVGEPKNWRIGTVYGENCGCGNQPYNFGGGVEGRKGGVVNALTAGDGVIGSVTGKGNYNGLLVDFAGGAECSIGPCAFSGGKRDEDNPFNGSGIDYYLGSGGIVAPCLKSDEAPRFGLAIVETAGDIVIGAQLHASGESGARITGGRVSGTISVSAASQAANNAADAVSIEATSTNIRLNLNIAVTAAGSGNSYRHAYRSSHSGSNRVRGLVHLVADAGVTGTINRGSVEVLTLGGGDAAETYGVYGFGITPIANTMTRAFFAGDVTLTNSTAVFAKGLVFDVVDSRWEHIANGYGFILRQDPATGAITLQKSGNNASGVGAPATLTTVATW